MYADRNSTDDGSTVATCLAGFIARRRMDCSAGRRTVGRSPDGPPRSPHGIVARPDARSQGPNGLINQKGDRQRD